MKTIIAGSRTLKDYAMVAKAMKAAKKAGIVPTEVVSGAARGADALGELWAKHNNVPVKRFLPKLGTFGKAAGPMRNREMANYAEALVALWDGASRGTANMIDEALRRWPASRVFVYRIDLDKPEDT